MLSRWGPVSEPDPLDGMRMRENGSVPVTAVPVPSSAWIAKSSSRPAFAYVGLTSVDGPVSNTKTFAAFARTRRTSKSFIIIIMGKGGRGMGSVIKGGAVYRNCGWGHWDPVSGKEILLVGGVLCREMEVTGYETDCN